MTSELANIILRLRHWLLWVRLAEVRAKNDKAFKLIIWIESKDNLTPFQVGNHFREPIPIWLVFKMDVIGQFQSIYNNIERLAIQAHSIKTIPESLEVPLKL